MPPESASLSDPVPPHPAVAVEQLYRELEVKLRGYRPEELAALKKAFHFANQRHASQQRLSGEPFMVHPLRVAGILADMRMDLVSLVTGLLHDVVEDTKSTVSEIRAEFGEEVAHCVGGLTKLTRCDVLLKEDRHAESLRKMFLAGDGDTRIIVVKLVDRLHNMRTLEHLVPEKRARIARETTEIYTPIARRLGMGKVRVELEDLAFKHLEPSAYREISAAIESRRLSNEGFLAEIRQTAESGLRHDGVPARVDGRVRRPSSVFKRLRRQEVTIDRPYDPMALRILTGSTKDCYVALGTIHTQWQPLPGRIKDFIATPRPNLYQSLHTSVLGPRGQTFEVQIRTEEMHRAAEEGIAEHWQCKGGRKGPAPDDRRIAWLRRLVEWQRDVSDPAEFMSALKVDLYPEEVFTFTPRGKVLVLPRDATPIDFAYAIHSDVGNTCVAAKVNGRVVRLESSLCNGDIVEIVTQPGHEPSEDWLAVVKTAHARIKIKHLIKAKGRIPAIELQKFPLE